MTDRERWTVYPLLFLTLGIAVKDKAARLVNVDRVFCKALVVTDEAGKDQVVIMSTAGGGLVRTNQILVTDHNGRAQVEVGTTATGGVVRGDELDCKKLLVTDRKGHVQVEINSSPAGGAMRAHSNQTPLGVQLGYVGKFGGLILSDAQGLPLSATFDIKPPVPDAPAEANPAEAKPANAEPRDPHDESSPAPE